MSLRAPEDVLVIAARHRAHHRDQCNTVDTSPRPMLAPGAHAS